MRVNLNKKICLFPWVDFDPVGAAREGTPAPNDSCGHQSTAAES